MIDPIDNLEERIKKAQAEAREDEVTEDDQQQADNMRQGMMAGSELVGCIAVGGFIGWLLDGWLETKPLFLIIFLLFGIATGFYNVYRTTQGIGTGVGSQPLHRNQKQGKQSPDVLDKPNEDR